ncbi:MAG: hypothetical protein ABIE22_01475 [archaeon]
MVDPARNYHNTTPLTRRMALIRSTLNKVYPDCITRLPDIYLTNPEVRAQWHSYSPREKELHVFDHTEALDGRRVCDILDTLFPNNGHGVRQPSLIANLGEKIVTKCVKDGYISKEELTKERYYRSSVGKVRTRCERLLIPYFMLALSKTESTTPSQSLSTA